MILYAEVPAFYATVEQLRRPELRGRPVIVGGDPAKRGLVQSASLEARRRGVTPGTTMREALARCPDAHRLTTDLKHYREVSGRLRGCLRTEVPALEPLGLGSAFLDVGRGSAASSAAPAETARRLVERVRSALGLPLCVGIASRKFLARLVAQDASDGEIREIPPGEESAFLAPLPLGRLPEVGPKTVATLRELGAETVSDLLALDPAEIEYALGNRGLRILDLAHGNDRTTVRVRGHPQSLSREHTFSQPQVDLGEMWECLQGLSQLLEESLQDQDLCGSRVVLKVRFEDQETITRSRTIATPITTAAQIYRPALGLLERTHAGTMAVRLLGLAVGGLGPRRVDPQLDLFR